MERIKQSYLQAFVDRLNAGKPGPYNKPGRYDLDFAYGGVKLVQYCQGGGQRDISTGGFGTKRDLWRFMQGMDAGLNQRGA